VAGELVKNVWGEMVVSRACNMPIRTTGSACSRGGLDEFGGRCWQHRPVSDAERVETRRKRAARVASEKAHATLGAARCAFDDERDELIEALIETHESDPPRLPSDLRKRIAELVKLRGAWDRAYAVCDALGDDS